MTRVPVQLELPSNFVPKTNPEYIPPISHVPSEAEVRRNLPPHTLVLRQQHLGAIAADLMVRDLEENGTQEDLIFGTNILSAALIGSARLSLRGGPAVMRRHLHLPIIADPTTDERLDLDDTLKATLDQLAIVREQSGEVYQRNRQRGRVALDLSHKFGRSAGDAALWVALLPHGELGANGTTAEVQQAVRAIGLNALETSRRYRKRVGQSLSLAMLGGPTTRLSSYVEERAPHGAYKALRDAQSEAAKLLDAA